MNKWLRLGIAVIVYTTSIYLLSLLGSRSVVFVMAAIGLAVWWMGAIVISWWIESWWRIKIIEDDYE